LALGWIERYNKPQVKNFVAWVGPMGGQYGVPSLGNSTLNEILENTVRCCIYDSWVQNGLSFASYWKGKRCRIASYRFVCVSFCLLPIRCVPFRFSPFRYLPFCVDSFLVYSFCIVVVSVRFFGVSVNS